MLNQFKTMFFMSLLTILLVFMGGALGGQAGMLFAFAMALIMNFGTYWFSDRIVLSMYNAQEIQRSDNPAFYGMVERLAQKAQLPMPRVYIIPDDSPNAFATGRNPQHAAVAATEGIIRILSMEELEGVMAHELGHVKNRDILISTIAATFAGAISMLANMLQWGAMMAGGRDEEDGGGIGGLVGSIALAIIAPIMAMIIQMAVSRSREYLADATGAEICGKPVALASALSRLHNATAQIPMHDATPATAHMFIVNPLSGGAIMNLFSTHPPMEERIARLRAMAQR